MSSSCCARNEQLEQMMERDEKNKHFIQAKTLEKIHVKRNENKNLKTFLFVFSFFTVKRIH